MVLPPPCGSLYGSPLPPLWIFVWFLDLGPCGLDKAFERPLKSLDRAFKKHLKGLQKALKNF